MLQEQKLAIHGGAPAKQQPDPPMYPGGMAVDQEEEAAVLEVLRSKHLYRYNGPFKTPSKVDELEKEGKHRDAWMKVPDPSEYPEQAEAIRKRKSSLSSKFAPDLFAATAIPLTVEQSQSDEANVEEEETNQ